MTKRIDLTGQTFGRLTVIEYVGRTKGYQSLWRCKCSCGNEKVAYAGLLRNGHTRSCGCLQKDATAKAHIIHGLYHDKQGKKSKLSRIWTSMKQRCSNPNDQGYINYGGRGISVCKEWLEYLPFYEWAINNGYEEGLSIDRKDNDGNYEPSNCRWATSKEQSINKRNNNIISINGKNMTLPEWGEQLGINYKVLSNRLRRGWSVKRTLTQPIRRSNSASNKIIS